MEDHISCEINPIFTPYYEVSFMSKIVHQIQISKYKNLNHKNFMMRYTGLSIQQLPNVCPILKTTIWKKIQIRHFHFTCYTELEKKHLHSWTFSISETKVDKIFVFVASKVLQSTYRGLSNLLFLSSMITEIQSQSKWNTVYIIEKWKTTLGNSRILWTNFSVSFPKIMHIYFWASREPSKIYSRCDL